MGRADNPVIEQLFDPITGSENVKLARRFGGSVPPPLSSPGRRIHHRRQTKIAIGDQEPDAILEDEGFRRKSLFDTVSHSRSHPPTVLATTSWIALMRRAMIT
jgi:hypothetical protein